MTADDGMLSHDHIMAIGDGALLPIKQIRSA